MPRPRADFSCVKCAAGDANFRIQNLPVDSKRCPFCGRSRGFKRLFDAIQVSTKGHRAARFIDKRMRPAFDKKSAVTAGAQSFERDAERALDMAYEKAPAEARQQIAAARKQGLAARSVPAATALGAIDPAARADSRMHTWPMVARRLKPEYS